MDSKLLEPIINGEMITEWIKESRVDLRKIERVTTVAVPRKGERKPWHGPFVMLTVVRFLEPTDAKEFFSKFAPMRDPKFEERTHQGKRYHSGGPDMFFFQADDKTLVFTEQEESLQAVLSGGDPKSPLAEKVQAAGTDADVVAVAQVELLRELIKQLPIPTGPAAKGMGGVVAAAEQVKAATLTIHLSGDTLANLALECTSAESGQKVNDALKKALDGVKPLAGIAAVAAKASRDTPPAAKDAIDVGLQLLDGIRLSPAGNQVVVTLARPKGLEQLVATLPQVFAEVQAREEDAALRAMRSMKLHMIGLAMLNYEQTNRYFPANVCDAQGKPLLSWRVAVLPYLDKSLYGQFRLDEPWDSPNNKRLLDRMPPLYQGQRTEKDGKTTIMVFTGKDSPFEEGKKLSLASITDGTSVTILAVEAGPDKAVPWTKPDDLPFDPQNPKAALGNITPSGFLAVMFDASVHFLKSDISAETLARLINPRDGQRVDAKEVGF
jgi:hypothetical protein